MGDASTHAVSVFDIPHPPFGHLPPPGEGSRRAGGGLWSLPPFGADLFRTIECRALTSRIVASSRAPTLCSAVADAWSAADRAVLA